MEENSVREVKMQCLQLAWLQQGKAGLPFRLLSNASLASSQVLVTPAPSPVFAQPYHPPLHTLPFAHHLPLPSAPHSQPLPPQESNPTPLLRYNKVPRRDNMLLHILLRRPFLRTTHVSSLSHGEKGGGTDGWRRRM